MMQTVIRHKETHRLKELMEALSPPDQIRLLQAAACGEQAIALGRCKCDLCRSTDSLEIALFFPCSQGDLAIATPVILCPRCAGQKNVTERLVEEFERQVLEHVGNAQPAGEA